MSSENSGTVISAAISGLVCLLIGAAAAYFVLLPESVSTRPAADAGEPEKRPDNGPGTAGKPGPASKGNAQPEVGVQIEKLKDGNRELVEARDKLRGENADLKQRMEKMEGELAALRAQSAARRRNLPINFGGYADLKELQEVDWKDVGAALQSMSPAMTALGEQMRAGKSPDREMIEKIQKDNMKLIKLAVALEGKLASNAGNVNGEYTHPVTQVNLLAAQLEAMGDPLTDEQKLKLAEHGEEYERRWKALQQGYNAETMALQKVLDEADLKIWFTEQMFSVTTQQQKAKVVDPANEGLMQLDLYSPGLLLAPLVRPISANDKPSLKTKFKNWLAAALEVPRESMDGQEYAFDEWFGQTGVEPSLAAVLRTTHVKNVLAAGRAQLVLMRTLGATALSAPENIKKLRQETLIGIPQLVQPE